MNKIVRTHYPVSELPDDLRLEAGPASHVTVTLEPEEPPGRRPTLDEIMSRRQPPFLTADQIDTHIRAERDAWDD